MTIADVLTYTVFLPLMFAVAPRINLGAYMWGDVTKYGRYDYLVPGQWVKWDINWPDVETSPGVYNWPWVTDTNAAYYKQYGYRQLINTQHVPVWARMYPDLANSPPKPEYIDDWIRFVDALLERYQPEAIELWNEPDTLINSGAFWSTSFGDMPGYYAEVIAQAYTALKPKYPDTAFVVGALTLGNEQDEAWINTVIDLGLMGDALSFHSYTQDNQDYLSRVEMQYNYLRQLSDKPLWMTETALLSDTDTPIFRQHQAEYLQSVYSYSLNNLDALFWYSQNDVGWKHCNMIDEYNLIRHPVWYSFVQDIGVR